MKFLFGIVGFLIPGVLIPSMAAAQTVEISSADCSSLVRHAPDADVAFKPGVGLDGAPVAPANLNGAPPFALPESFSIPITVDLQKRLGIPADPAQYQTREFTVGTVVWQDGAARFNGQPLQSEESRQLALLCQQRLAAPR